MSKVKTQAKTPEGKIIGNYSIQKAIGEGTFGKVHLGIHLKTNEKVQLCIKKVAIKILEKDKIKDNDSLERVRREICFLKSLKNENIIQLYEIIENNTSIFLIMEFAEGGELFTYIVKKQRLNDKEASFFFCQIINTIETIHKYKIAHRDLKPENLLLSENKFLKIIDFGLSNNYTTTNPLLKTPCGSPCYAAPEMLQGKKYNGLQIDIWSIGIILYAMINGFLPFEDENNTLLYKKILECKLYFPFPLSDIVLDMIHRILNINPEKRITLEEIKNHEFYLMGLRILHKKEITFDKQRLVNMAIEKMKTFNFNKNEVLNNLADNNHNDITTTFYLIFNRLKSEYYFKNKKLSVQSIPSYKPLITLNDSPNAKKELITELADHEITNIKKANVDNNELRYKNSDHIDTISNGKKSNSSKNNSKKKISYSIDQTKLPLKSKIIIFKKHNKSKAETPNDIYLKTEAPNCKDICKIESKDVLLTEVANEKSISQTTFSYKKLCSNNINKNINLKTNYLSTEAKTALSAKVTERVDSSSTNNYTGKNTPQKETPFKNYLNLNVFPLSIQNGSKMFTKIKINPNLQFLLKDFKQKVNNKSLNKDRDTNNFQGITQTEGNDKAKHPKKIINFTGNLKNHSISNSNKNEYSQNHKNESSVSRDKKLFENPILSILHTETNNHSSNKLNTFNKSNLGNTNERLTTLTSFFNKNEMKVSSPKLHKLLSSEKHNSINYKLVKPKIVVNQLKDKKDIIFNKNETVFNIDDISNLKEKIFSFCKRNLYIIKEIDLNRFECYKDTNSFGIDINKYNSISNLKVTHLNGKKEVTNEIIRKFLFVLEKGNNV